MLRRSASILLILATLQLPGPWAQAIPGGATTLPAGRGIRRTPHARLFVVDGSPTAPCRFSTTLQPAIDAASDGDVVLVKPGSYFTFAPNVVDGKSLTLIGEGHPVLGGLTVRNCTGTVVVRGFNAGSVVSSCPGFSWFEDCGRGVRTFQSRVGVFRSSADPLYGNALGTRQSTLVVYNSSLRGEEGYPAFCTEPCAFSEGGWPGSSAVSALESSASYFHGSSLIGGAGGDGMQCPFPCSFTCLGGGCGGPGLVVDATSTAIVQDTLLGGGPGGDQPCGAAVCNGPPYTGSPVFLPQHVSEFWVDSPVEAGDPIQLHARGPAGWRVFLRQAPECTPSYEPEYHGYALVPVELPPTLIGEIPISGVLDVTLSLGNLLAPGAQARVIYLQADFHNPLADVSVLGTPSVLVVYKPCP